MHNSRLLRLPLKETAAGEGVTLFRMEIRPSLAVFQTTIPLVKPEVKAVQNANREKDSASYQESPKALCKAGKDVRQPGGGTKTTNDCTHYFTPMMICGCCS